MPIPLKNVLAMATASIGWKLFQNRRPINIMFAPTDRCTGQCVYCKIPERKSKEMTLDQIKSMLDEAASMGAQRLGIWGGEPLLRKDLGDIIAHAKSLSLFVTVDTNGHLIPKCNEALRLVDHMNISLNGDKQAHEAACGAGSFDRTMTGIKHAIGRHPFWTITVLTKANIDKIDWILETGVKYGFLASFQPLHHNDKLGANDNLRPEASALRQGIEHLLKRKNEGAPIASSKKYLEHLLNSDDFKICTSQKPLRGRSCLAGNLYCNVDVDGSLYPCSLLIDEYDAPVITDIGFKAAFEKLKPATCQSCLAACFTEYNLLYHLDFSTGLNWMKALMK